jgi:hypothetical protein
MKIWELESETIGYYTINTSNFAEDSLKYFKPNFKGNPIEDWKAVDVQTYRDGKYTDAPQLISGIPILSKRAIECLSTIMKGSVEILPLSHPEYDLYAVNVLNVIDAIDYKNAEEKRLSSGHFVGFNKYAFHFERVQNQHIFKIPETVKLDVFVSDEFRDTVLRHNLVGFRFIEVWDSEVTTTDREEKLQYYQQMLNQIEQAKGEEFSFSDALTKLEDGKAVASGKWRMQHNNNNELLVGELIEDCTYQWLKMVYYPPIFLQLKWHVVEKMDTQSIVVG